MACRRNRRSDSRPSSRHRQAPEVRRTRSDRRAADSRSVMCGLPVTRRIEERLRRHERIVRGGDDQRRHADAVDDPHRARVVVIVFGAGKTEVRRGEDLVEVADGRTVLSFERSKRPGQKRSLRRIRPSDRARNSTGRASCPAARARARIRRFPGSARPRPPPSAPPAGVSPYSPASFSARLPPSE